MDFDLKEQIKTVRKLLSRHVTTACPQAAAKRWDRDIELCKKCPAYIYLWTEEEQMRASMNCWVSDKHMCLRDILSTYGKQLNGSRVEEWRKCR